MLQYKTAFRWSISHWPTEDTTTVDEDRKIRFLISPMVFLTSVGWGVASDPNSHFSTLIPGLSLTDNLYQLLALFAGGGIAVVALGVLIGNMTHVILRVVFCLKAKFWGGPRTHEISLGETLELVWRRIRAAGVANSRQELFAGVTFDYDVLLDEHKGVRDWIVRRWNAFSIAATSVMALVLSLLIGSCFLKIALSINWCGAVAVASIFFFLSGIMAWRDTMEMLRFQAERIDSAADEN